MASIPSCPTESPLLRRDALVRTLAALVRINSVNPDHGGPPKGERQVLEWVQDWLRAQGFAPRLLEPFPGRSILRVLLDGEMGGPPLLFETHIDTVSAAGMSIDPFAATVENDRLWGRGATDAKGQAAAMLHALAAWKSNNTPPPRPIELALVCDEEFSFSGARALLADGVSVRGIVVGEPTDLRVVATHKGAARFAVVVEGRLAHAARPSLGVNAISAAAVLIDEINLKLLPELAGRSAPLLGPPALNIAMIEGGQQPNLIPDRCRVLLERRLLPGETAETARREVEALFTSARERFPQFQARLEPTSLEAAAFLTDPQGALAVAAGRAAESVGRPAKPIGVDYCTDASILVSTGAPMIVAGPGSIDQAHTQDEFILLEDLEAGARFYAALMGWDGG